MGTGIDELRELHETHTSQIPPMRASLDGYTPQQCTRNSPTSDPLLLLTSFEWTPGTSPISRRMPVAEIGMSSFMLEEEDPSLLVYVYATKLE